MVCNRVATRGYATQASAVQHRAVLQWREPGLEVQPALRQHGTELAGSCGTGAARPVGLLCIVWLVARPRHGMQPATATLGAAMDGITDMSITAKVV